MAAYCSKCFEPMDVFHTCNEEKTNLDFGGFEAERMNKKLPLVTVVGLAPFMGVLFDLFIPLPSSVVNSLLLSLIGSASVAALWVSLNYTGNKSFTFYLKNLRNFLFTPNILKIFTVENHKKAITTWTTAIVASSLIQIFVFTTGNANYLAHQVTHQIDQASGANLEVKCPSNFLYFYQDKIECRVKTGILGITVPARAKPSPFLGEAKIKVSLI